MSDTEAALDDIFAQMPARLNADAAAGLDCVLQYDLTGDASRSSYATIREGVCTVSEGSHDSPSMTLTMEAADFVALISGELDGMAAFMGGKLKISGDMSLAMKMQTLFS